jgi:mRNA-degrading endonuclease toxin of MazEF toxin-antitoxin module
VPFQPLRGQVYKANLNPLEGVDPGHEHRGDWKPVLVLQVDQINRHASTTVVVPLTTNLAQARLPTGVAIDTVPGNVLTEPCVALCHQVRALDVRKLRQLCGQLPADDIARVADTVRRVLGL